jgi:hypothetical protein
LSFDGGPEVPQVNREHAVRVVGQGTCAQCRRLATPVAS